MSFAELTAIITAKGGPQNSGTMAEYNKFAEPENFTGSYAANLGLSVLRNVPALAPHFCVVALDKDALAGSLSHELVDENV